MKNIFFIKTGCILLFLVTLLSSNSYAQGGNNSQPTMESIINDALKQQNEPNNNKQKSEKVSVDTKSLLEDEVYMTGVKAMMKGDYDIAFKCFQQCANNNNAIAWRVVGYCYRKGYGVNQNISEAKKWYKKAIAAGDDYAVECYQVLLDDEKNGNL